MTPRLLVGLSVMAIAASCGGTETTLSTQAICPTTASGVIDLALPAAPTEGIAFGPDGALYVSGGSPEMGTVWRMADENSTEPYVTVESALGLAFNEGSLFIAGIGTHTVYKVESGTASAFGSPVSSPNFLTATPWGALLASNDFSDEIFEVSVEGATLWSNAVSSPNGMAFSNDGKTLYAVTTFETNPGLYAIAVDAAGKAGPATLITKFSGYPAPDGIAVGSSGEIYVALNLAGKVVRVDPVTGDTQTVAEGLKFPASLAFGRGGAFDECSLYVTQLFGKGLHKIAVGETGASLFGIGD